jgi:hypothetical protein
VICVALASRADALAQDGGQFLGSSRVAGLAGAAIVLAIMSLLAYSILTSRRMHGSSAFNRLFIVVAVTSMFFSGLSSAIGFSLITSQETDDFLRNALLPPAFGVFVFFLGVAIWVGGAELVRNRDWFRGLKRGLIADAAFFLERSIKLFVIIPILSIVLFLVSTWTTVVGIGGVDAVRHTYSAELARLKAECAAISAYRQKDRLFVEELKLAVADVRRVAQNEIESGAQTGAAGEGRVSGYFLGVAAWLAQLEASVVALIAAPDPTGLSPYDPAICAERVDVMKRHLSGNAYLNYDRWAREFETQFEDFVAVLNAWRQDRRIERLLEQQLEAFERANPRPTASAASGVTRAQVAAIDRYASRVESALKTFIRKQKLAKPPVPLASQAELSPERGLGIIRGWFDGDEPKRRKPKKVSRTAAVVAEEKVPGLSTITPRDAVLKNASVFSDAWALGIAWDYASYILMLAYLFFPSAERAAGFKDER